MIVYNVTIKVDHSIADVWCSWLRDEHIPDVIGTGCFTEAKVLQLLETDESDGITYAVQYYADSKASYNRYIREHAEEMRKRATEKWGNKFIAFAPLCRLCIECAKESYFFLKAATKGENPQILAH